MATGGTTAAWTEPTFDPQALPSTVPTVEIVIPDSARASLDAAPFYGDDVTGAFVDGDGKRYDGVDVNYRGAYALQDLINGDPIGRRNWKVKFVGDAHYRQRREWNYTFSPSLRQLLAYDLMRFAGVRVPSARHVRLSVNGKAQGLYLEYEDPDSKEWLSEMFGDKKGDLYKAALDVPASEGQPEQKYFAETTYLGADDSAYLKHYNKKTNNDEPAGAADFSVVRNFLDKLNALPDGELVAWIQGSFELDRFFSYLVVSNFIANWDSFPQRPKNFWLYEIRRQGKISFIPWDIDNTFQQTTSVFNKMGTKASVLYDLLKLDYTPYHTSEGTQRPLAWRILAQPQFKAAYLARYRDLLASILSRSYLTARMDALSALVQPFLTDASTSYGGANGPATERSDFTAALDDMRGFVSARIAAVTQELASIQ
jgi:spore coat protein H